MLASSRSAVDARASTACKVCAASSAEAMAAASAAASDLALASSGIASGQGLVCGTCHLDQLNETMTCGHGMRGGAVVALTPAAAGDSRRAVRRWIMIDEGEGMCPPCR